MAQQTILVVGGAGFIGSQVNKMLNDSGYRTIVLDNLSTGSRKAITHGEFIKGDIADAHLLDSIFTKHKIDAVMHFAALIDVGESVSNPDVYYQNNVVSTLILLNAMQRHSIKIFIFSSSAAIYGLPINIPISEDHPALPINPYGRTKWMVEQILQDFDQAYGLRFSCLRYFNAAGGDPSGIIKNYKTKEHNLIPIALRSLLNGSTISIFGTDYSTKDGTCIRDYIHVADLAIAHILAMKQLMTGSDSTIYNLGNGHGFSVRQVLETIQNVTKKKLKIIEGPRRPGDPPALVADASKAKEQLLWEPLYPRLDSMVEHAWKALNYS